MTDPFAPTPLRSSPAQPPFARGGDTGRQITSERIDAHIEAFRAAGGVVEVLGNTPLHKPWRAAKPGAAKPSA